MHLRLATVVALVGCGGIPQNTRQASPDSEVALLDHAPVVVRLEPMCEHEPCNPPAALRDKLEDARKLAEKAINDRAFRRRVLAYASSPTDGFTQARRAAGRASHTLTSNAEALQALLDGNDGGQIHLFVQIDDDVQTSLSSYATTDIRDRRAVTFVNQRWLASATLADVAENLIHEHMHRLGFEHERGRSKRRCGSVPYAVGKLVCAVSAGDAACLPAPTTRC